MDTLSKIHDLRPDHSDYVYHFTKGRTAGLTLLKILKEGKLKDKKSRGFICFTEAPLLALPDMFNLFDKYPDPMLAAFGIGIPKSELFAAGGRQVIYGPEAERNLVDPSIQWRYEVYNEKNNFAWLREWRLPDSEYQINSKDHFIIAKNRNWEIDAAYEEGEIDIDFDEIDGQYFPSMYIEMVKNWKSVSFEDLKKFKSNLELGKHISDQSIGSVEYMGL